MRVPGVANVAVWGNRKTQYQVQVDPVRLRRHGVTVDQVRNAAADAVDAGLLTYRPASALGTGGFVESGTQRLGIEHVSAVGDPRELGAVTVRNKDGKTLRLDQVAEVRVGHQPLIGDAVVDGGPGLLLIVEKFPWANTLQVTEGVEEVLAQIQPGMTDVRIDATIFRPATFIETSIDNLTNALLLGILLVILVLIAFLYEWRTALISAVAIPLSLVAAGLVLYHQGSTINTMVLAGLVISVGVVVDDAIIDVENIWRRLKLARATGDTTPTARIVLEASIEVRRAIVYATLINVAAITPVFFLEGLSGAFFRPLVTSYALALLASMAVALTVTPALALLLLRKHGHIRRESPLKVLLVRWYSAGAEEAHEHRTTCVLRGGGPRTARGRRHAPARTVAPAGVQGTRLPDALDHQAGHVAAGRGADHHVVRRGPGRDPGRAQLRGAHRSGEQRRRGRGAGVRRELDQHRSRSRLRRDLAGGPDGGGRVPGPLPRRADVPEGADPGGAHRDRRGDRRANLR